MPMTKPSSPGITTIARQVGLPREIVSYCVEAGLVHQPLTAADVAELRRIRRLRALEVNLPGIEIILRLRRRVLVLQTELAQLRAELSQIQSQLE